MRMFMVLLAVSQVALSGWNSHAHSVLTKLQIVSQDLCIQYHLQWIKKKRFPQPTKYSTPNPDFLCVKWCFMEGKSIFQSPNACVPRVDVSIQVKPFFTCKESFFQMGHIVANEIKKLITILMVLPCTLQPQLLRQLYAVRTIL